ncbi:T cell receptor delta variable 2 [Galemys pyrenaicus]|nr:T cell receptor delta variable 2 [Galemys pyrenaicus]
MQELCFLVHLTLFWAGVRSAIVLVPQDQMVTVPVGASTTFKCSMQGGGMTGYYISWYRRTQSHTVTFIYREGDRYGPGFQGRFQGKVDGSNNRAELKILKVLEEDEGSYHCTADNTLPQGHF